MLDYEKRFHAEGKLLIAGVDEAGRGPLAGPVYAAAVIFPPDYENEDINDSKKLTAKEREALFPVIEEHALAYGIASVSAEEIDEHNIYEATKICMKKALAQIQISYDMIITDAMPLLGVGHPLLALVKGDAQCLNVAAASILAKVSRDRYMTQLEEQYPSFHFSVHKGYGTKQHLEELRRYGPIEGVHRKSFSPVKDYYPPKQGKLF